MSLHFMNPLNSPTDTAASVGAFFVYAHCMSIFDESGTENLFRFPYGEIQRLCYNNNVVMETFWRIWENWHGAYTMV